MTTDIEVPQKQAEMLERSRLILYMQASTHWCAIEIAALTDLRKLALDCYQQLLTKVYDKGNRDFTHIPFFLVFDLLALALLGERVPFRSDEFIASRSPIEQRQRRDYENLLNTLLQATAFRDARERLPLETNARQGAAMHLVQLILEQIAEHYPRHLLISPSHSREIIDTQFEEYDPENAWIRFATEMRDENLFTDAISIMLEQITRLVYWRDLLKEEDLFEVENWAVLDLEATRIGCRQLINIERLLSEFRLPTVRLPQEAMEVDTTFDDDTTYPTGGFAGLTNRGSFENLVRSELVYMNEATVSGGPSMFELRFVESELLYYLRNDGVMRRRRRFIHLVVDLTDRFYYKSPGYAYPFAALTQGLLVRLTRDLLASFEEDAVTIHIHYRTDYLQSLETEQRTREQERLDREQELLRLVLAREVRQELVEFHSTPEIDLDLMQQRGGRNYLIAMLFDQQREAFWRSLFQDLRDAKPPVFGLAVPIALDALSEASQQEETPLALPLGGLSLPEIAQVRNAIFAEIMGAR